MAKPFFHSLAIIEEGSEIGDDTKVWHFAHLRKGSKVGSECIIAKNVFIDAGVTVGNRVKIQNNVSVYAGVTIEDGVFVGPHVCFTNDLYPRAINPDGSLKSGHDWVISKTLVGYGAAIGANSTIRCGIKIGKWAMIAAGSVVTKDVPDYALVMGSPARLSGVVAPNGEIVSKKYAPGAYKTKDGSFSFEV